ncbi:MAG: hypothetical protein ABI164_12090, partial [Acidobacteriaceae bacterium]
HSKHTVLRQMLGGWSVSETVFVRPGLPFSVLSGPYIANGKGIFRRAWSHFEDGSNSDCGIANWTRNLNL